MLQIQKQITMKLSTKCSESAESAESVCVCDRDRSNNGAGEWSTVSTGHRTFVGSTNDAFDECTLLTLFGVLTTLAPGALSAGRFSVGPVLELLFRRFSGRDLYLSRFWPK